MKKLLLLFCILSLRLFSLEKQPWLGNWLEFEANLTQTHTESHTVDTTHGIVHKKLYADRTAASLEFMPNENLACEVELDLAKTQKKEYGFDAVKAACRYRLMNDLAGDPVSLTAGLTTSLSTPSRVKDMSTLQHGVLDTTLQLAVGREFVIHAGDYYKAWALAYSGLASSGSPWIGLEAHWGRVFSHETHAFDLFFRAEKGLSDHKLHKISQFHSYSRLDYQYEELGLCYTYKERGFGSLYIEATTRLHAKYCPRHTWSARVGLLIPFSPW